MTDSVLYNVNTDFASFFNPDSGMYFTSGIMVDDKDTGVDPFMSSIPELIDVGIMGHCIHGLRGLYIKAGIEQNRKMIGYSGEEILSDNEVISIEWLAN